MINRTSWGQITLPDGTQIAFKPLQHVGQENFSVSGAVILGWLELKLPGKEMLRCSLPVMVNDLRNIMMKYNQPEYEDPPDYSHSTPSEVRDRTFGLVNVRMVQAFASLAEALEKGNIPDAEVPNASDQRP